MYGTRTDFEPIVTTFVVVDEETPRRQYRSRPSRHEQRRLWLPKQYGGRR